MEESIRLQLLLPDTRSSRDEPHLASADLGYGQLVSLLLDSPWLEAGTHEARLGGAIPPGVYFYRVIGAPVGTRGGSVLLVR